MTRVLCAGNPTQVPEQWSSDHPRKPQLQGAQALSAALFCQLRTTGVACSPNFNSTHSCASQKVRLSVPAILGYLLLERNSKVRAGKAPRRKGTGSGHVCVLSACRIAIGYTHKHAYAGSEGGNKFSSAEAEVRFALQLERAHVVRRHRHVLTQESP